MRRVMEVEQALLYLQDAPAFLCYTGDQAQGLDIWSPWHKLPIGVRRAIYAHRQELLTLMHQADARTCPSPEKHRKYWRSLRRGLRQCTKCFAIETSWHDERQTA
jgi:hypothetical protein